MLTSTIKNTHTNVRVCLLRSSYFGTFCNRTNLPMGNLFHKQCPNPPTVSPACCAICYQNQPYSSLTSQWCQSDSCPGDIGAADCSTSAGGPTPAPPTPAPPTPAPPTPAPPACFRDGKGCAASASCCSGNCFNETCDSCKQGGAACSESTQCCAQVCGDDGTCGYTECASDQDCPEGYKCENDEHHCPTTGERHGEPCCIQSH